MELNIALVKKQNHKNTINYFRKITYFAKKENNKKNQLF